MIPYYQHVCVQLMVIALSFSSTLKQNQNSTLSLVTGTSTDDNGSIQNTTSVDTSTDGNSSIQNITSIGTSTTPLVKWTNGSTTYFRTSTIDSDETDGSGESGESETTNLPGISSSFQSTTHSVTSIGAVGQTTTSSGTSTYTDGQITTSPVT